MSPTTEAAAAIAIAAVIAGTSVEALPSRVEPTPRSEAAQGTMDSLEAITDDKRKREEAKRKANP